MKVGDWVVLPSKLNRTIHFGEIKVDYCFNPNAEIPYYHYRDVRWFALDVPRDRFEQDILYSSVAFMTVCKIHKNNAEERLQEMYKNNWQVVQKSITTRIDETEEESAVNLEEFIFLAKSKASFIALSNAIVS